MSFPEGGGDVKCEVPSIVKKGVLVDEVRVPFEVSREVFWSNINFSS